MIELKQLKKDLKAGKVKNIKMLYEWEVTDYNSAKGIIFARRLSQNLYSYVLKTFKVKDIFDHVQYYSVV